MKTPVAQTSISIAALARNSLKSLIAVTGLTTLIAATDAHARPLWIIHTNDLHSHLYHATDPNKGGYSRVKTMMDQLKDQADAEGVDTLILDGGDFTDGSQYFFANKGREAWRIMNYMGYDAIVLGNHDWLISPGEIDQILGQEPPTFAFLAANFKPASRFQQLKKYLNPYEIFKKSEFNIGVVGMTTPELFYKWRAVGAPITSHVEEGFKVMKDLDPKTDFVFAITHLGVDADKELAERVPGIDLVVGGHSHDFLYDEIYVKNKKTGRKVPIVQAGKHGEVVGSLKVDLVPGKPVKVLDYQLIPIEKDLTAENETIQQIIDQTRRLLERDYGEAWLYEEVGYSFVPLERQMDGKETPWSSLVAEAMVDATDANLSLDIPEFTGNNQAAGPITREKIMAVYPRTFNVDRPLGWTVWNAELRGWILEIALREALKREAPITLGGVTFKSEREDGKLKVSKIRLRGEQINPFKNYTIAVPEAIGRGAVEISPMFSLIVKNARDSGVPIWTAIEDRVRKVTPIRAPAASQRR